VPLALAKLSLNKGANRISNTPPSVPSLAQIHARRLNRLTPDDPRSPFESEAVKAVDLATQECRKRRLGDEQRDDIQTPASFFHHLDADPETSPLAPPRPHVIRLSMMRRANGGGAAGGANRSLEKKRSRRRSRARFGGGLFGCVRISAFV
jgi:hypothetical protein